MRNTVSEPIRVLLQVLRAVLGPELSGAEGGEGRCRGGTGRPQPTSDSNDPPRSPGVIGHVSDENGAAGASWGDKRTPKHAMELAFQRLPSERIEGSMSRCFKTWSVWTKINHSTCFLYRKELQRPTTHKPRTRPVPG